MSPFSWQCQKLCWLRLAFNIDWRVVKTFIFSPTFQNQQYFTIQTKKMCGLNYRAVLFKWEFIIQMRDAVSQPSLDIEESYFSKNTLFFFKNDFSFYYLKLYTPSVPLIGGFKAFFGPPFCSLTEGKEEKDGSKGKSGSVCLAAALTWMIIGIVKEAVHKKGQIDQKCAINCYIKGNVSSKNFTKYKNMFVVKSILKSIQRFARYRIVALIWIGRLCSRFLCDENWAENRSNTI